ncbi:MAG: O-antigen polymerase family protein [Candidatus Magasanikbacteria bacterium GW2011_GWC2_34_16]|uniref:O-antigen polymerase family protein n=2 Tax=Candidatus Magasanikiibacteriota TaxID=1752731 RepID=A0A0G0HGF2_9BACT|nr:MAG: O-antigen polymerase family protein [Candidatus Magasanikbacteria bacterium GW2011_GWC2_34_16]KKQ41297.1 MAG: O-antigen polymerase family protein [Candidatus Magasanikbacteria bacterium GW2011_GWA2_37_8]
MKKIIDYLLLVLLFLIPWQTRLIYRSDNFEYGTLSLYGTEILLGIILFLLLLNWLKNKNFRQNIFSKKLWQLRQRRLLGMIILFGLFFWWWQVGDKDIAGQWLTRMFLIFGLVGAVVASKLSWEKSAFVFWLSGVVQGVLAVIQFLTQYVFENKWLGLAVHSAGDLGAGVIGVDNARWLRAYGSLGGPNPLGIYLAIALVLGLIIYLKWDHFKIRILLSVGQIIILVGLIFSFSRSAWLAGALGIIFVILLERKNIINLKLISRQIFYYLLLSFLFVIIFSPLFFTRLTATGKLETTSLNSRRTQYSEWQQVYNTHPWLGVGSGNYFLVLLEQNSNRYLSTLQPIHNSYLLILAELGIVGLSLFVYLVGWLVVVVWQHNRQFLSVIIVLLVSGLFEHWPVSLWPGMLVVGVIFGVGIKSAYLLVDTKAKAV